MTDPAAKISVRGYAQDIRARPFVKWAGGKRSVIPQLLTCLPRRRLTRYFEPFVGGGALFFAIESKIKRAFLSDMNEDLMIAYKIIKTRCDDLIKELQRHERLHKRNDKGHYMAVRKRDKMECLVERAARFIYLNKTCYNGLYRVNKSGQFNVPMGTYKNPRIIDADNICIVSEVLSKVQLARRAFDKIQLRKGDMVYCDPPYDETYDHYTECRFNGEGQKQLSLCAREWHKAGAQIIISNSDTELIRDLYKAKYWHIKGAVGKRSINCKANGRGKVREVIITNYSVQD